MGPLDVILALSIVLLCLFVPSKTDFSIKREEEAGREKKQDCSSSSAKRKT
jgi:hypothetical protein